MSLKAKPHRVLYVHSGAERFGSDNCLLQLALNLDRSLYRPAVLVPNRGPLLDSLAGAGVPAVAKHLVVLRRKCLNPGGAIRCLSGMAPSALLVASLAHRGGFSLVHSNTSAVLSGAMAARLAGLPHIWHVREILTSPDWVARSLAVTIGSMSDVILAISGGVRDNLAALWDACGKGKWLEKVEVVPDGVDVSRFASVGTGHNFRREIGVDGATRLVGIVGGINHWKGQDYFLKAAARLAPVFPDAKFLVVGGTYPGNESISQGLHTMAGDLRLDDAAIFTGERRDIPEVMSALDVVVVASTSPEPFGMVVVEAMAAGKPVVATAAGGPLDIVVDGETGFLVPPCDDRAMAAAVARLLQDGQLARRMGEAGRQRACSAFSLEQHIANIQHVYDRLILERGRRKAA